MMLLPKVFTLITHEGIYTYNTYTTGNTPTTYGRLLVLNNNYTGQGSYTWLWQLAFDTAGKLKIRESINSSSWTSWSEIAYTNSPTFTGTPTAPTPSTSDNSTKIATTAFVKSLFTANKSTNGWHKEASTGIIYQWGYGTARTNTYFPISFPNKVFTVLATQANVYTSIGVVTVTKDNVTNSYFNANSINSSGTTYNDTISFFAIGY